MSPMLQTAWNTVRETARHQVHGYCGLREEYSDSMVKGMCSRQSHQLPKQSAQ